MNCVCTILSLSKTSKSVLLRASANLHKTLVLDACTSSTDLTEYELQGSKAVISPSSHFVNHFTCINILWLARL